MRRVNLVTLLVFVALIVNIGSVFSQNVIDKKQSQSMSFAFPILPKYGKTPNDLILKGWSVIDSVAGDLNKDNMEDVAMVLEYQDSIKINKEYDYPRILLIAFKNGDHFESKLQHNTLIERKNFIDDDHLYEYDPFASMSILKGVLHINFSWDERGAGGSLEYVIRYQSNDFYLIGATMESGYRADTKTSEFNFSTRKYVYHEIDDETGFGGKYHEYNKKGNLPANALKKLTEVDASYLDRF